MNFNDIFCVCVCVRSMLCSILFDSEHVRSWVFFSLIQNALLFKISQCCLIHYNNLFNSSLMHYCLLGWDAIQSSSSLFLYAFKFVGIFFLFSILVPLNYCVVHCTDQKYPIIAQAKKYDLF